MRPGLESAIVRSRLVYTAGAVLAIAISATVVGLLVFAGSGEEPPQSASVPSTSAPTTTTTTPPTTAAPTTTTTLPSPPVTLDSNGPRDLRNQILAFYTWLADPDTGPPDLPEGLAGHVAGVTPAEAGTTLELSATVRRDVLADGSGVAVAVVGDDLLLLADEGGGWRIVGARLTSFGLEPWYGDPIRHVFLIGTDARPHQDPPVYRADSLHIVAASLPERAGGIVGFPRDTYVDASYGRDKYSSVNARADTGEVVRIAEDLSGIELDGYILTGFAGFKRIINLFGGVEVDVPFAMSDSNSRAYLEAGPQVLKGGPALSFSRNRHINGGDFTRSRHQGIVIKAVLAGSQVMGIERLPRLLSILSANSWTNLSAADLLQLGAIAFEIDPGAVGNVVLPGRVGSAGGASIVRLTAGAAGVFEDLADGIISPE
jgi:LCP family protein required for cell wall assembly